jgi:hypothetical protein
MTEAVDSAIETAAKHGKIAMVTTEDQRKRVQRSLAMPRPWPNFKAQRAGVAAKGRQAETEAAPIRYVAELPGVPPPMRGMPELRASHRLAPARSTRSRSPTLSANRSSCRTGIGAATRLTSGGTVPPRCGAAVIRRRTRSASTANLQRRGRARCPCTGNRRTRCLDKRRDRSGCAWPNAN